MEHSFNIELAKIVGVNSAVIFKNISHWCEKNKVNNKHFHEGMYWTYNGIKAFELLFPYLSGKQIKSAIDKLVQFNLIKTGEYNQNPYDRTKWYCDLTQESGLNTFLSNVTKCQMEIDEMSNVECDKRVYSITDVNTNVNTDNKRLNINEETSSSDFESIDLFGEIKPIVKNTKAIKKEEKEPAHKAHYPIKKFWFEEFRKGSKFQKGDGKLINSIIENIEVFLAENSGRNEPEDVIEFFKVLCYEKVKLKNQFLATCGLSNISSSHIFTQLVETIKINSNGQQTRNNQSSRAGVTNFKFNVPDPRTQPK